MRLVVVRPVPVDEPVLPAPLLGRPVARPPPPPELGDQEVPFDWEPVHATLGEPAAAEAPSPH